MFELVKRDGLARICRLETAHGTLETPALLPVINPKLSTVSPRELYEEFGFKGLITNSYIIRNDEGLRERALNEGLHSMLDFPGVIMTDSGTFQSHMYGEVEVRNEDIVSFQRDIGSDIGTVLDIFTEPYWSEERTAEAVEETLRRTRVAADMRGDMFLAGVVQGSTFTHLREHCARELSSIDAQVHPIGGVVPLMEQYRFAELVDVIASSKRGLVPDRPVHLFGAGHPMVLALATLLGCDMFDSASYAKYARGDRMMFVDGTMRLRDMKALDCNCPACQGHSLGSLLALDEEERARTIARHNLYELRREMEMVRRAILEGSIWELAERRCRAHPALLDGLRRLREHVDLLERYEPLSREGAVFYTGPETLDRPAVLRYAQRVFERYRKRDRRAFEVLEEGGKPYSRHHQERIPHLEGAPVVFSAIGPVPLELDEVYPVAQSLLPLIDDREAAFRREEMAMRFTEAFAHPDVIEGRGFDIDALRVRAVADHQFGEGAADALFGGEVELVKSRNTGKIRNVLVNGEHILSMRAHDGLFTLRPAGARRLHSAFSSPRMRVIVEEDSVTFNREGKNVFTRFVWDCDPGLRPMEEVLVVDRSDALVAIGRTAMVREEMLSFKKGVAVKVREGVPP